jgi:DnaJ-class molecular chaperone
MTDPFAVLGVERTATPEQIKTAYRKLAMTWHPDRNPGDKAAEAKFKEINAAYEKLKNPDRRPNAQSSDRANAGGFEFHFGGDMPFGFEQFFRQGDDFPFGARGRPRNHDVSIHCTISLEQAMTGVESATMEIETRAGRRTVIVAIPAGADNGMRLRVTGEGERQFTDLPPGDLYVHIAVAQHARFERYAQNLAVRLTVDGFTAMLGGSVEVDLLGGGSVMLEVPTGVQPGQRLRITGHGMPIYGSDQRGDLLAIVEVRTPTLTEAQRVLIETAAGLAAKEA